jgi:hypothetical protein
VKGDFMLSEYEEKLSKELKTLYPDLFFEISDYINCVNDGNDLEIDINIKVYISDKVIEEDKTTITLGAKELCWIMCSYKTFEEYESRFDEIIDYSESIIDRYLDNPELDKIVYSNN